MSKKLLFPKSPFEEILVKLPFSILPKSLKFFNFSDKGAIIFCISISISVFKFSKSFLPDLLLKIFCKLLASNRVPFIEMFLSNNNEKSLFLLPPSKVLTETFFSSFFLDVFFFGCFF